METSIIGAIDLLLLPIYLVFIYLIAFVIKSLNIKKHACYRFFIWGLTARTLGVIAFCMVYSFYYEGGDTISYFDSAIVVLNLFSYDPVVALDVLMNNLTPENYSAFNSKTGWPMKYMWKDRSGTFTVVRLTVPFVFFGARSFLIASVLLSTVTYIGVWKLYRVFTDLYPKFSYQLAISILLMPTLIFWGTGIMKDSYTLSATCWITYNFYHIFIRPKKVITNVVFMILNMSIIIYVKPYVILSLLPGMLIWLYFSYIKSISSPILKLMTVPIMIILVGGIGYVSFGNIAKSLGGYGDLEGALDKAKVIQQDLLRESQYGSNNYYIGEIDGSISNSLSLAPMAIFTALYRPSIVEIGSPMMVVSVIENTVLLGITIIILLQTKIRGTLRLIGREPMVIYSFIFSLFFAFGVGMASTNFGALVRYKAPLVPFYFSALFILNERRKEEKLKKAKDLQIG